METSLKISHKGLLEQAAPLYYRVIGNNHPQPAYLSLDSGTLHFSISHAGERMHRDKSAQVWSVSPYLSRKACENLLNEVAPVIERVIAEDSDEPIDLDPEIIAIINSYDTESCTVAVIDAAGWIEANEVKEIWPENESIQQAAEGLHSAAASESIHLDSSCEAAILELALDHARSGRYVRFDIIITLAEYGLLSWEEAEEILQQAGK